MFNELLESTLVRKNTSKSWTVAVSIFFQITILGVLVLIPLLHAQALPKILLSTLLVAPPPPPPPPPPPVKATVKPIVRQVHNGVIHEPTKIPPRVLELSEPPLPPEVAANTTLGGIFTDIPGQGIVAASNPVAPVAPLVKPTGPNRIKVGGVITSGSIVLQTKPVYPPLAQQARIQGSVVLHAIIDTDGRVAQLEVVSGPPLLVKAAMDAARQWRYKPTLLDGDPVEVDTTITVTFSLGG